MALGSPGIQISVNNQSQYVASNVGSIPLVILATAQDKQYNGQAATGTSKALAGRLQSFTSQRDLVTTFGTPTFHLNAAGTPIHGSEINEYGLLTAYSALGLSNQLFAIRADIDLNQLTGTSVRPVGKEASGTQWMNLGSTEFGIYSLNAATSSFTNINSSLLKITNSAQVSNVAVGSEQVATPNKEIGQQGSYALVFVNPDNTAPGYIRLFYKVTATNGMGSSLTNTWVQVNSPLWQASVPTLSTTTIPTSLPAGNVQVNGTTIQVTNGTTVSQLSNTINSSGISGVGTLVDTSGHLVFFSTYSSGQLTTAGSFVTGKTYTIKAIGSTDFTLIGAASNTVGVTFTATGSGSGNGTAYLNSGTLTLVDDPITSIWRAFGLTATTTSYCPILFYGDYAHTPSGGWFSTDSAPKPSGSIWWKTTSIASGWNPTVAQYSANSDTWNPESVPMYSFLSDAIYGLDPVGGGANVISGQIAALNGLLDAASTNSLQFVINTGGATTVGTSGNAASFAAGHTFTVQSTAPGTAALNSVTITTTGTTPQSFVSDILNANIPYVTAQYNTNNNTINITHTTGGYILLTPGTGASTSTLINAGFGAAGSSATVIPMQTGTGQIAITNFKFSTSSLVYSTTTPFADPDDGTMWYYSNPADVDIMINDNGWKGYKQVTSDVRGYNLSNTDANGVIVTATTAPTSQSTGAALVAGDLWLDSGDLVNYPRIRRYNGSAWILIDNTDHVSNNGVIFADARWDSSGTIDGISGNFPSIATLLTSNYIDQDAPDYRLYPRGTLMFNTRRSGFNVKKYVKNYFNHVSFPALPAVPGANSSLPVVVDAWVSASGSDALGVMYAGAAAQRNIVIRAMQSAVNSNNDILDANYNFNLIVAPGYPELIPSLVTLNDNRGSTGFIIGDTPMTLPVSVMDLTQWNANTGKYAGKGLATASPYLGIYYPAGLTTDLAGNTVAVPASHAALRTYLYNDQVSYPWFAPAGVTRGLVSNLNDIGYIDAASGDFHHNGINHGMRDALYSLNINPITQLPGVGLVIWGQETRSGDSSARSRVNVVRLENYLRVIFARVSNGFLFEPNDTITRKSIATQIESSLHSVLSLRGLYDFAVVCDTSNNTSATIANSLLYVDVAIEPMRDVEFIYIPIAIYNPGTIGALGIRST